MKRQILFVDDEPMVLKGLQRTLRKMRREWDMNFVSSGHEALDVLDQKPMDVIVSDLRMPEMDGGRLLAEVKKRHPHVVRILLTGQLDQEMTLKSVQLVHQSLSKPCDAQVLKHTLAKLFALRDFLADESIKSIVSQIESLPSLPSIYTEIVTEMQADDPSIKKVGGDYFERSKHDRQNFADGKFRVFRPIPKNHQPGTGRHDAWIGNNQSAGPFGKDFF